MWDFEDEDFKGEYTLLCSNRLERIDNIKTPGLNKTVYKKLWSFLFGSASNESEEVICSALNFWRLIFASMDTTDSDLSTTLSYHRCVGYHWEIDDALRKKLHDEKALEIDVGADPNELFTKYCRRGGISWLRHRVLEITDNLGDVTPNLKDDADDSNNRGGSENDDYW